MKDYKLSEVIVMLEKAFDLLNENFFECALSKSVITIQSTPRAYGHFSCNKIWNVSEIRAHEINLGAETLNRSIEEVIATLVHEMVHQYCSEQGIKDTSRGNTYNNKKFKEEAEKRGLIIECADKIGWSVTTPAECLKKFISEQDIFQQIALCRITPSKKDKEKKKSSTRKYICPICKQQVRSTKDVFLICGSCFKEGNVIDLVKVS